MTKTDVPSIRRQHGAASLIVVMLLFFLMMLVTAYASRSMVFEQRTSANQYHSTQASDAAEAGLQWTLAMLNGQHIDDNCLPTATAGATSFRDRYLRFDDAGHLLTVLPDGPGGPPTVAACVRLRNGWSCQCPAAGTPNLDALLDVAPLPTGPTPSFGVKLAVNGITGFVTVDVAGCASVDVRCQAGGSTATSDAVAQHQMQVALRGLANPPIAALTTQASIVIPSAAMRVVNTEPGASGFAAQTNDSAATAPNVQFVGPAGTPDPVSKEPAFGSVDGATFFASYFGVTPAMFPRLPGVLRCAADCGGPVVAEALAGRRLFWIDGDLTLPTDAALGSAAEPVMLIVAGRLTLQGAAQVRGLVYANALTWSGAGGPNALVQGATIVQGGCCDGTAAANFVFDGAIVKRLSLFSGALLQVPGSWQDTY